MVIDDAGGGREYDGLELTQAQVWMESQAIRASPRMRTIR